MSEHPNLAAALAAFQAELPTIVKTKTAKVKTKTGGEFIYTYAGLPEVSGQVLPLLAKHGLSFVAKPTLTEAGGFVLAYKLQHMGGDEEGGEYPLPSNGSAQELGSAITYARRYALCSVVGVAAEDDDDGANAARTDVRQRREPEPEWDPIEQVAERDGWEQEIAGAKTLDDLEGLRPRIATARGNGRLSPVTLEHLQVAFAKQKAELSKPTEETTSEPG